MRKGHERFDGAMARRLISRRAIEFTIVGRYAQRRPKAQRFDRQRGHLPVSSLFLEPLYGYISTSTAAFEIRESQQHRKVFGGSAAATVFLSQVDWTDICSLLKLSRREAEIAHLVLTSHSEAAIASNLAISTHTVHSHLERLYRKLQIRSRCELIIRLFEAYVQLRLCSKQPAELHEANARAHADSAALMANRQQSDN